MDKIKAVIMPAAFIFAAFIAAGCGSTQAPEAVPSAEEPRGRDFVRLGTPGTVTGTLKPERGECFLVSGDDLYEIHLGDHDHREKTGIKLKEGKTATVKGFIYRQKTAEATDMAVVAVTIDGTEYRFREDDGTPLWRGRGGGPGEGARDAERSSRGEGRRR